MEHFNLTENEDRFYENSNGLLHREDGPAAEWDNGDKFWYINGKLHREDGPAIEYVTGPKAWFLNGKEYSEKQFNKEIEKLNLNTETIHEVW